MSRLEGLIQAIWWTNAVLSWKTKIWGPKNRNLILETYLSWVKWNILLKWIIDCIKSQNQKLTEGQDWSGMGMEFWAGIMLRPQLPKCHYLRLDFVVISTKASSLCRHHLIISSDYPANCLQPNCLLWGNMTGGNWSLCTHSQIASTI